MKYSRFVRRNLSTVLPLKQSLIVFIIVAVVFIPTYYITDRFVVRQKMGDLMNLADAKFVHVLDFLDQGKKLNEERADNDHLIGSLTQYETNKSPQALTTINAQIKIYKDSGRLLRKHEFDNEPETRERFSEILVLDNKGVVIASTEKEKVGDNLKSSEIWEKGSKKTSITNPIKTKDGAVFYFVSPIYAQENKKGPVIGVLATQVNTKILTIMINADLGNMIGGRLFFAGFQYRSLDIYIIDKQGYYITQSRLTSKDTVLRKKGSLLPWRLSRNTKAKGDRFTSWGVTTGAREAMDIYTDHNGVTVAGASMPFLDEEGWTLIIEQPVSEAFAGLINLGRAMTIGALLVTFLAGFLSWRITKRITDSLAHLDISSVNLAGGDVETPFTVRPKEYNEIKTLAASFDILRRRIKELSEKKEEGP